MLLILFFILDMGKIHIVQSDAYKAVDAAALAGAAQANYYRIVDYEQKTKREAVYREIPSYHYSCRYSQKTDERVCKRVPPYTQKQFDHWAYNRQPATKKLIKDWVQIREKDAKQTANKLFWRNARHSTVAETGRSVLSVDPHVVGKDKMAVQTNIQVNHLYFPSFVEGFFNGKEKDFNVVVHKEAESQAIPQW